MIFCKIYLLNRVVILVWIFNKLILGLIVLNLFVLYFVFKGCEIFNLCYFDYICVFEIRSVCEVIW